MLKRPSPYSLADRMMMSKHGSFGSEVQYGVFTVACDCVLSVHSQHIPSSLFKGED